MRSIYLILLFTIALNSYSQDTFTYKSGGRIYNSNNQKLNPDDLKELFSSNPKALKLYNSGRSKKTGGNILFWSGLTTLVGKFIYDVKGNHVVKNPNNPNEYNLKYTKNTLYYVAGGFIVLSILIKIGYPKKIKKSIMLINDDFKNPKTGFKIDSTNFISNSNGFGISITF